MEIAIVQIVAIICATVAFIMFLKNS